MNDILIFEAQQFKISLTDYNFIAIEQDIPFMKNNAIIQINPDDIADFVQSINDLNSSKIKNIEVGKYLFTTGDDDNPIITIFDNEKYDEDEDQFINIHCDQSELLIKWILELKKIAVKNKGFDTLKIKTPPTK